MKRIVFSLLLMFALLSVPTSLVAGPQQACRNNACTYTFTALSASGSTELLDVDMNGMYPTQHSIHLKVTGAPTSCSAILQATNKHDDGSLVSGDFTNLATVDCTTTTDFSYIGYVAATVRVNLTMSGGTSPTVTPSYSGAR